MFFGLKIGNKNLNLKFYFCLNALNHIINKFLFKNRYFKYIQKGGNNARKSNGQLRSLITFHKLNDATSINLRSICFKLALDAIQKYDGN